MSRGPLAAMLWVLVLVACATTSPTLPGPVAPVDADVDPGDVDAWWVRSTDAAIAGDFDAAAIALARIARAWPDLLGNVPGDYIHQVAFASTAGSDARLALLAALFDSGWDYDGLANDALWVELAALKVDRGDSAGAAAAIDRISSPESVVRLRIDRRFDGLVDRDVPRFDVALAVQRESARLARLSAAHPRWLEARNALGVALLLGGQDANALANAEAILAAVEGAPPGEPPFDDMDELNWTQDARATALRRLGRIDEAVAVMREGSGMDEFGQSNVSQALNLGAFLCALGRADDAQAAIADVAGMSRYGTMVQAAIRHCIALQQDDAAAAAEALAYVREHRDMSPTILLEVLLEAGRVDEAGTIAIGLLEDPATRGDMLHALQRFREPLPLPEGAAEGADWDALRALPAVQEAVRRVGRIERHPIFRDASIL